MKQPRSSLARSCWVSSPAKTVGVLDFTTDKKKGAAEAAPEGYPVTGKDQNFLVRLTFQVRPRPLAVNGS